MINKCSIHYVNLQRMLLANPNYNQFLIFTRNIKIVEYFKNHNHNF